MGTLEEIAATDAEAAAMNQFLRSILAAAEGMTTGTAISVVLQAACNMLGEVPDERHRQRTQAYLSLTSLATVDPDDEVGQVEVAEAADDLRYIVQLLNHAHALRSVISVLLTIVQNGRDAGDAANLAFFEAIKTAVNEYEAALS